MKDKWRVTELGFSGAVALFTLVLSVVSYFQYDAARKAARRAMRANKIAKKALVDVQRAYIFSTGITVSNTTGKLPNESPDIDYAMLFANFENSGNTPARKATHIQTYCVTNPIPDLPPDFDFAYPKAAAPTPTMVIPPRGKEWGRSKSESLT